MKYILVIAIEEYNDPHVKRVQFAMNDANAFIGAWEQHGFTKAGQYILLNEDATKTSIESRLRRMQKELAVDDELVVYYAGHGFSVGGVNVLTAWDTQYRDIEHTSIPLANVLGMLRKSQCTRIKFFLDACHAGIEMDPAMRGVDATMSADELKAFFEGAEHCVAFAACHSDEKSYSSRTLKHGIWTHHVIEALSGKAPLAIEHGALITSNSLQNYLRKEVPRTVRETVTGGPAQTPWMFGGSDGEFIVADVAPILAARIAQPEPASAHLPRVSFRGEEYLQVKRLNGFMHFHTVPKKVDSYTESFVEKAGSEDVQGALDEAYSAVRDGMGYKRRDLKKNYDGGSGGTILTPDFDYNITLSQDKDDPSQAVLQREITHIQNPTAILSDEFQSTFHSVFDTIEFSAPKTIDVVKLIDTVEDNEPDGIEIVDYDEGGDFCALRVDGITGIVRITPDAIELSSTGADTPRALAELFGNTWNALLPAAPIGLLPGSNDTEIE